MNYNDALIPLTAVDKSCEKYGRESGHTRTGAVHIFNISEVVAESCTGMQKGS